jgi:hypothetical protein
MDSHTKEIVYFAMTEREDFNIYLHAHLWGNHKIWSTILPIVKKRLQFCPTLVCKPTIFEICGWIFDLLATVFWNNISKPNIFRVSNGDRPSVRLGDFVDVGPPIWTKTFKQLSSCIHYTWTIASTNSNRLRRINMLHLGTSSYKVKEWKHSEKNIFPSMVTIKPGQIF